MISTKTYSMQAKQARVLQLSCLSCLVALVIVFGYNLHPRLALPYFHFTDNPATTHSDPQAPPNGAIASDETLSPSHGYNSTSTPSGSKGLRYAIILPTYVEHIPLVIDFLQSFMCLCTDYREIDIHVILSDSKEVEAFDHALDRLESCGETFSIFPTPATNINGPKPKLNIVNLFDILPPVFHSLTNGAITAEDTSALLRERDKYQYQTIKKMAAAIELEYDWALWLDSEAIVVQPFSIRQTFESYIQMPTIWRSRMANTDFMRYLITNSANVLGRTTDSFGPAFWNLESVEWIVEKAVFEDLVRFVERAHNEDFWTAWATRGGPFEISLYNMHIQARKLETVDSIFSKYLILETEREMDNFGLGPAKAVMETMVGTGLLERGYKLLQVSEIAPNFSTMLNYYGQRLLRFEDLDVAPPEVIDRFLLDTPIDILCSGAPPLHSWWEKRKKTIG